MASPSQSSRSPTSRKMIRLGLSVAAVILVYTGAWHFAATALEERLQLLFEQRNPLDASVECEDRALRGYPFRIGLFCSRFAVDDHTNGISASFGGFRSAAQVYAPGHIVWELDGPGEIRSTAGVTLALQWKKLHSSVSTRLAGLDRSSLEATDVKLMLTTALSTLTFDLAAPHYEMHVRRNGEDLDSAALVRELKVSTRDGALDLPPVSASLDMTLLEQATLIDFDHPDAKRLYGTKAELRRFVADLGDDRVITLSGPLSVGQDGLLSGQLHAEIENIPGWSEVLKTAIPLAAEAIDNGARILIALSGGSKNGTADLTIRDGVISLGFFPIGVIPPL